MKVTFGIPVRQTTGFVASLLRLVGLFFAMPGCSTPCRRQIRLSVNLPFRDSADPIKWLIDRICIKSDVGSCSKQGRWVALGLGVTGLKCTIDLRGSLYDLAIGRFKNRYCEKAKLGQDINAIKRHVKKLDHVTPHGIRDLNAFREARFIRYFVRCLNSKETICRI